MEDTKTSVETVRDASHDKALVRWAEFVRDNPREKWKRQVDVLINAVYQKSDDFYQKLKQSEEGNKILARLKKARLESVRRG